MAKVRVTHNEQEAGRTYVSYDCPACNHRHSVPADRWNWNGDISAPTLSPSVLHFVTHDNNRRETVCHYFIRSGKIEYCSDCPHDLAGQTVDLPDITPA